MSDKFEKDENECKKDENECDNDNRRNARTTPARSGLAYLSVLDVQQQQPQKMLPFVGFTLKLGHINRQHV